MDNRDFFKVVRIGRVCPERCRSGYDMFCKITYKDGNLSISGVEGPLPSGGCKGSAGQIVMSGADALLADMVEYAPQWDEGKARQFFALWDRWHLNDIRPECEHQRALGWTYNERHGEFVSEPGEVYESSDGVIIVAPDRLVWNDHGHACPVCGYRIGSAFLREEVPAQVVEWLRALPNTDKKPAWI